MTTIATDGVTLAADSRATSRYYHQSKDFFFTTYSNVMKVSKNANGHVAGFAGNLDCGQSMLKFFASSGDDCFGIPEDVEDKKSKAQLLELRGLGNIWVSDYQGNEWKVDGRYHAIGSGAAYALGAMEAGASPAKAVKIASMYDEATGGPVVSVKVNPLKGLWFRIKRLFNKELH